MNKPLSETAACLLLVNSQNENSVAAREEYEQILTDMRIAYQVQDIQDQETMPDFDDFRTVVLLLPDVSPLGDRLLSLCDWVSSIPAMILNWCRISGSGTSLCWAETGAIPSMIPMKPR